MDLQTPPKEVEVIFTKSVVYETDGPGKGPKFEDGQTYRFPEAFAQRWIRRGVAEIVAPKPSLAAHVSGPPVGEGDDKPAAGARPTPGGSATSKR